LIKSTNIDFIDDDKIFLEKMHVVIENNIDNIEFSVNEFAKALGIGRSIFFRKMKNVTGYSPNEYLRMTRMKKAAELLTTTKLNISEVSYKVGINDPLYFSKCFKMQFGKTPSQYKKDNNIVVLSSR